MTDYDLLLTASLGAVLFMLMAGNRAFAGWVGVAFYALMGGFLAEMSPWCMPMLRLSFPPWVSVWEGRLSPGS